MNSSIEGYLFRRLSKKNYSKDEQRHLYLMQLLATAFSAVIHVVTLVFFLYIQVPQMVLYNICSIAAYVGIFFLVEKNQNLLAGLLMPIEVAAYVVFSAYFMGSGYYIITYLLVVMLLQLMQQYGRAALRYGIVCALWAGTVALVLLGYSYMPPVQLTEGQSIAYSIINVHVGVLGIVLQLTLNNQIQRIVSIYNEKRMQKLSAEANIDPLTNLYNRRFAQVMFNKISKKEMDQDWCVAILDIDGFKKINDVYGHDGGDRVLIAVSHHITNYLRGTDLVFRWGGDEVLLLLKGIRLETAAGIMEKLRVRLADIRVLTQDNRLINLTVTIGVNELDPNNIPESVRESDRKLYEGKRTGKNRVVSVPRYYPRENHA